MRKGIQKETNVREKGKKCKKGDEMMCCSEIDSDSVLLPVAITRWVEAIFIGRRNGI